MSIRDRAVVVVRALRSLFPTVRSIPRRLAGKRHEGRREQPKPATRLIRESALAAAKSLRAPIVSD